MLNSLFEAKLISSDFEHMKGVFLRCWDDFFLHFHFYRVSEIRLSDKFLVCSNSLTVQGLLKKKGKRKKVNFIDNFFVFR